MLHTIKNHKATFLLITIWTILYLLGKRLDLLSSLAGRGIDVIGRFPMGVFLYWPNFCFAAFKAGYCCCRFDAATGSFPLIYLTIPLLKALPPYP